MRSGAPRAYRAIISFLRLLVRAFFRRVVVSGVEHIPKERGGIVVSWHPNGLIDPGLLLTQLPRQVVFGARHGVFRYPVLGTLMRQIGTVPIFRASDLPDLPKEERAAQNAKSLDALAEEIAGGSFSALFPEGVSHDAPHLRELKTGAARLFYQARSMQDDETPAAVIVPVGLHYDEKDLFRSSALVEFFPPIELGPDLQWTEGLDKDELRARARRLTDEIERVLHDVVLATESWELHRLMHRARKLMRAERAYRADANPGKTTINERVLGFARVRQGYNTLRETQPEVVDALVQRVDDYDADLRGLGIQDHELDRSPRLSAWIGVMLLIQVLTVFFLLPPLLLVGVVVNAPAALLLGALNSFVRKHKKDEATVKIVVGALLFPLTWVGAGILAGWTHTQLHAAFPTIPDTPILAGVVVALLSAFGGAMAVRYLRVARETTRAVRVRLTRAMRTRTIARLRVERAEIHDALAGLSEELELPGEVLPDGRVVAS
jgi:glycerol-3-phosphate O-acyltransferase/dihydroxyacetone phosphate acyltransferase